MNKRKIGEDRGTEEMENWRGADFLLSLSSKITCTLKSMNNMSGVWAPVALFQVRQRGKEKPRSNSVEIL